MVTVNRLYDTVRARSSPLHVRSRFRHFRSSVRELPWQVRAASAERRWRRDAAAGRSPNEVFGGTPDDQWLWLNTTGRRRVSVLTDLLPGVPDESMQLRLTGMAGDQTLRDGWRFYRVVKDIYRRHAGALRPTTTVLDFGCGWGRTIRFFLKD